ncbi:MAG: tRNA uridine-5-carboxymethylaminomethyl(34) synthesis GTPase MnmE [Erysipelotrichaceae bacterium]|nr:tRNA uridine-5-carboxymethylaminomethyl(34) synthesis GTPase MnmE [Erysipelotrichaceae bacterium]
MLNDTICAISTALKDGAISIVRMSGEDAFSIIKEISDLKETVPNRIAYGHIIDNGEIIDEVLISCFGKGHSYTCEDMVEINCHGGVYVTKMILNLLLQKGCRLAEPGEFTKRAYLNGRIDLSEADAINDLVRAESDIQARSAIRGLNGSIERLLTPLMDEMKDVLSMIEVNIDYPEYEDEKQMTNDVIKPYILKWQKQAQEMIEKAERFSLVKDGIDTVIIGKPNVGKSSLLNALLEQDKAIVTDIEGTTRDLVEGKVRLKDITLNLIDTAGLRETQERIEQIGIAKTYEAIDKADLIIIVLDSANIDEKDKELLERYKDRDHIVVYNKSDLKETGEIRISALHADIASLTDYLNDKYQEDIDLIDEDVLNNERQIALMKQCLNELDQMTVHIDEAPLDMVITDLEEAYHYLCQILGKEYQEDLIDHMFRNFCLGK